MPIRRGHLAPANTFIDTVIKKFDGFPGRNFVIGNALSIGCPIIYCNSSFCELTGYERHELVQQNCACLFLHGPETEEKQKQKLLEALRDAEEQRIELTCYKKNGEKFLCSITIAPIKNEQGQVLMYIVNHEIIDSNAEVIDDETEKKLMLMPQRKISTMISSFIRRKSTITNPMPIKREEIDESENLLSKNPEETLKNGHCINIDKESEVSSNTTTDDESEFTHSNKTPLSLLVKDDSSLTGQTSPTSITHKNSSTSLLDIRSTASESQDAFMVNISSQISSASESAIRPLFDPLCLSGSSGRFQNGFSQKQHSMYELKPPPTTSSLMGRQPSTTTPTAKSNKVAQVMSLGSDVLPEYKVESPKIHPWTILHYSPFKAIWDWVVLFLVMYTAIVTPYMAAFVLTRTTPISSQASSNSINIVDDPLVIVDYIVDVMFIVDIFINFRTTFVDSNDEVVSDPCRVAVNYMKGWFLVDLLAAIPFELLIMIGRTDQTTTLIGLLKTARLLRLVRVARKLDRYSEYGTALLMLLMCGFALVAHWLACVWYAIGNFEQSGHNTLGWLTQLGEATNKPYNQSIPTSGPNLQTKYLTALYFTLSSLTSVGFGNVSANTDGEKIFTILIMFMGALMHAVIFGNVTAIIQRLYSGMAHYHATMRRVREFIRFYQIPSPLRQRLEDYSQYDYSYTNGIDMNEVLRNFPEGLQADICLHLNRQLLQSSQAFRNCTPGCLRALSLKLCTTHCPPGDYIIHNGDEITTLYWIGRGTVEIIQNDTIIAILGKGDSFGENFGLRKNCYIGKSRASVRALTYCDLHSISRDNLLYIMRAYPEFRKQFNEEMQITYDLRDSTTPFESEANGPVTSDFHFAYRRQSNLRLDEADEINTTRLYSYSDVRDNRPLINHKRKTSRVGSIDINAGLINSPCNCGLTVRREIDDLRQHVLRVEKTLNTDIKKILHLLSDSKKVNFTETSEVEESATEKDELLFRDSAI